MSTCKGCQNCANKHAPSTDKTCGNCAEATPIRGAHWIRCEARSVSIHGVYHCQETHPDWFRSLRDQCAAAGVPFFFKQWGEWAPHSPTPDDDTSKIVFQYQHPSPAGASGNAHPMLRIGTKASGNLLDGVKHEAFPDKPFPSITLR